MSNLDNKEKISAKNDLCRKTFRGCRVLLTAGIANHPDREIIIINVQSYSDFNSQNDPYEERDFGSFQVNGTRYYFKFDYYDDGCEEFKENGKRVLLIGKLDEY